MAPERLFAPRSCPGSSARTWGVCLVLTLTLYGLMAPAEGAEPVDFRRDVLPILSDNCFQCHGPDGKARKADLRLDLKDDALRTKEPVIVPGKSAESEVVLRVTSNEPDERMPPPKSGRTVSAAQVETLKRWIDQGAKWQQHWAFETPRRPKPPRVKDEAWLRTPIDRFVLARLDAEGLKPSAEADKTTLIRRVTLDLTGLPPTLQEIDAFLADKAPGAYERVVDRLLGTSQYGERMAMDWLDVARYADTNGYQNDFARTMWPWRDWVIDAFNRNLPFDQFVIEQVAGDLLPGASLSQKIATGFNRNNRTVTEAGSIDEEWRIENAVDRVETTTTVFLGLTMGCCRCHDHKFDPISQKEFYQFLSFFNSVNEKGVYTETRGNVPPLVSVPSREDEQRLRSLDAAIAAAEKTVRDEEGQLAVRRKRWEDEQHGKPEPQENRDWLVRFPLEGDLHYLPKDAATGEAQYRGGSPAWAEGPFGKALRLEGKDSAFADAGQAVSLERTDQFSYGTWVRPRGDGVCVSKMDDAKAFRGFDLFVAGGKVDVHLVHAWPGDALKVTTKEALPKDVWTHVFVTYDGSSKAAGVTVYFNGRPIALDVAADTLRGTIATEQALYLGKRSASAPLNGDLADVRFYRRTLSAADVQSLVALPALLAAKMPAERRSKVQEELLTRYVADHVATELRGARDTLVKVKQEKTELEKQVPTVMVMEDAPAPRETYVLKRGQYDMPDKSQKLQPGVPASLSPFASDAARNRLGLARWLVASENPLTARVTVNRFWQHHFGVGLVKTAENFGVQSEPPSHPELLDWLATEFIRTGWDVKALHRLIVTSATYRQSSRSAAALVQRDPENRLLARGPRFRLPAETVRDNALAIAGLLVTKVGGPSIKPYQPAGLWEELAGGAGEAPYVQDKGANLYRRSLYIYRKRTVPHPSMTTFDAPSREICQVKRPRTNTPLQALELLNDVTYVEAARQLAVHKNTV
ncbi:MAG: DUF1553 domain-containing protein, partial [Isosphaeraceae bacterium]|nr:DUF1553 domain-containing protein [Isosphaeraceae bacterium]